MKKFFFVYKTTNMINGKFYIGKHETTKIDDEYLGSGSILKQAIEKYGINNFKREILFFCKNREELNISEAMAAPIDIIKNKSCYNICPGGQGGNTMINFTKEQKDKFRQKMSLINKRRIRTIEHAKKISEANKGIPRPKTSIAMKKLAVQMGNNFPLIKHASHPKNKNGRAKIFKFINNQNKEYVVAGEFDNFCKIHNLSRHYARKYINKGKISFDVRRCNAEIKCINLLGWEIILQRS